MNKEKWEIKKLGEVCEVISGQSPQSKFYNIEEKGMPFYQGKKEFGEKYIGEPTTWTTYVTKEAKADDILMSVRAPVGPINFSTQKICIGRGLAAIRAGKKIDKEFLFYFLLKHENEIEKNSAAGAVFKSISRQHIQNFQIPIPPLSEQQRIVSYLDQAFEAIDAAKALAEKNLANAKELFESYLQAIFEKKGDGWVEKKLSSCFKLRSGKNLSAKNMIGSKYPVYGGNGITGYHNEFNLSGSNVIIGRVGALCGNVRHIKENIWLTDNAFKIEDFQHQFDHKFLTYLLDMKDLRSYARQAAQPVISNSALKGVLLSFPTSLSQQKEIAYSLDALHSEIQRLESIYEQKIADLEEMRQSVLERVFLM